MKIPDHIFSAAAALLAPYGVNLADLLSAPTGLTGQRYMTAKQASAYCGLSAKTIRDKALSGEIESYKIGKSEKSRVLIERESLDRWITRHTT